MTVTSKGPVIAIDGPAGAGKTTAARGLAERLSFVYLDTGATFRAVALKGTRADLDLNDGPSIEALAREADIRFSGERLERILLDGEDVSEAIRGADMARGSAAVAVHPGVRARLVELWREIACRGGIVIEGRDIGTVVFPDADIKFFIDAEPEARARRRFGERQGKESTSFEQVVRDLAARDEKDRNREHSPLLRADDAILIDTTTLSADQTVDRLVSLVANLPAAGR